MKKLLIVLCSLCIMLSPAQAKLSKAQILTQKKTMLQQLVQLQETIKSKDAAALKKVMQFSSLKTGDILRQSSYQGDYANKLTPKQFDQYQAAIFKQLQPFTYLKINVEKQTVSTYRQDKATEQQKKRTYYRYKEKEPKGSYLYYYLNGNKRVPAESICDDVVSVAWKDNGLEEIALEKIPADALFLRVAYEAEPNRLTPERDDGCVSMTSFYFTLVNGQLKLLDTQTLP